MSRKVAYGVPWIPVKMVESFLKTKWELLDYTHKQLSYTEVLEQNPEGIIAYTPIKELLKHKSIKWIMSPGAGIDGMPLHIIKEQDIEIINSHANSTAVAEQAWALLLAAARKITKFEQMIRNQSKWPDRSIQIRDLNIDLEGKTMGIVGYGAIGKKLEGFANAFSMESIVFRRQSIDPYFTYSELVNQAENLDVLILACPLTTITKGILSESVINNLPAHCIIVNIARGELIDEAAVFDALREGKINSYASDVWTNSPIGTSTYGIMPSELVEVPNLIISPHRAWVSKESFIKMAEQMAKELDNISLGLKSENIIDRSILETS